MPAPVLDTTTDPAMRSDLAQRIRLRIPKLEAAICSHFWAIAGPAEEEWQLLEALRVAVPETLAYAIACVEQEDGRPPPVPSSAATQARRAARLGVGLGTIMRCCTAGERLLGELISAEASHLSETLQRDLARAQGEATDRLMDSISTAYMVERERLRRSPTQRISDLVLGLLAGDDSTDRDELGYHLDGWHLGLVVTGSTGSEAVASIARGMDRQLLAVPAADGSVWAWLGGRSELALPHLEPLIADAPPDVCFALGQAHQGLEGWRLTHREAGAAALVMRLRPERLLRGKDVLLLAAALKDETLADALRETYLAPFDGGDKLGPVLRDTLRAYLASGCNAVAAAAALRVNRHTVQRRLRRIEDSLGGPLQRWHAELKVALDLEELRGI
ncbi:MAG TPA: helix-turn-helix domain-containing protein [Solirubrobacterales bacterium]|nr:helix-turn-helix domain-containing protein [Solirubrobacterales bacterium]